VSEVQQYFGGSRPLDHVILNECSGLSEDLLRCYAEENAYPVVTDVETCRQLQVRPHVRPVVSPSALVRHDPELLATAILHVLGSSVAGDEGSQERELAQQAVAA
jgi:hypothetical protein